MTRLDDDEYIQRYDHHGILGVIAGQPAQLRHRFDRPSVARLKGATALVVAGMGGSALAGEFVKAWLADRLPVPLVIVRGYDLPAFVGPKTLVVASSYSGNTEEALSCLHQAQQRGAKLAALTDGGTLLKEALADPHPELELVIPGGLQPRLAVLYGVRALAELIEAVGWVPDLTVELEQASRWVETQLGAWLAATPQADNPAKQLAAALVGRPLVVYGGPTLAPVAMKWKIDANENAKHLAFYNYLPEFNHNEFLGWGHPRPSGFRVVELQSSLDRPQIAKRFAVTNRLLAEVMPEPIVVTAQGSDQLEQLLWTQLLGDFATAYLAFMNQIDPTPVPLIEKLKRELVDQPSG